MSTDTSLLLVRTLCDVVPAPMAAPIVWSFATDPVAQRAQRDTGRDMAALRSTDRALFLHLRTEAKRRSWCEALALDPAA